MDGRWVAGVAAIVAIVWFYAVVWFNLGADPKYRAKFAGNRVLGALGFDTRPDPGTAGMVFGKIGI
jgi:hypothetical protein